MTTDPFDIGDLKTLKGAFIDDAGADADPTSIVLTIQEPDGTLVTENFPGNITNPGVGKYEFDFAITKAGRHVVNWTGIGAVATAAENEFYARRKEAVP